jgi:hypothetical protein
MLGWSLTSRQRTRIDRLAALEVQMQKVWGPEVYMALSRTRQKRIRYFDQLCSRKEAGQQMQAAQAAPPGTLRVIDFPKEVMQNAMLEKALTKNRDLFHDKTV